MNTIAIIIISILSSVIIATSVYIIFLLLEPKKFTIESIDKDLEGFLNTLYSEVVKSNNKTKNIFTEFIKKIDLYENKNDKTKEGLNNFVNHIMNEMKDMKDHIASIQELSLLKEEKIKRYEEGYDQKKISHFTKGLFRILASIKEEKYNQENPFLQEIEEDILILLENNGIEKIIVDIGSDFKDHSKYAKIIATEETDIADNDLKVKEVKKDGYFVQIDENTKKVLLLAEVIVYKTKKGDENV